MKMPKKPKLRKFPKAPKSKNPEVLKRHLDKVKEVQKENDARMRDYKKACNKVTAHKKKIQSLKDQAKKLKSKSY